MTGNWSADTTLCVFCFETKAGLAMRFEFSKKIKRAFAAKRRRMEDKTDH